MFSLSQDGCLKIPKFISAKYIIILRKLFLQYLNKICVVNWCARPNIFKSLVENHCNLWCNAIINWLCNVCLHYFSKMSYIIAIQSACFLCGICLMQSKKEICCSTWLCLHNFYYRSCLPSIHIKWNIIIWYWYVKEFYKCKGNNYNWDALMQCCVFHCYFTDNIISQLTL